MSTTNINYQDLVKGYTMPFDYLWQLLVISEDKDFVLELADLVYDSEIEITIFDTYTETKSSYSTTIEGTTTLNGVQYPATYPATCTTITKTNVIDIALTLADVWMLKYTQQYTYEKNGENNTYVSSPPLVEEKTDPKGDDDNFVKLFLKSSNSKAKNNILSVDDWLFELIQDNPNTEYLLDLTKYLLYKATNNDYGIEEWDFSIYGQTMFDSVAAVYGNSIQEKVWFGLIDLGYSEIAVAGAMGNVHYESGSFDPTRVEGGYDDSTGGIGICQWTNDKRGPTGRNSELKAYAASKGVDWKDENTQVEFLIGELTPGGGADGYASYQLMTASGYSPNDWIKATTVDAATEAFCYTFERPSAAAASSSMKKRQHWANYYYEQFKGKTRGGTYNATSDTAAVKGYYTNSSGKKFTILNQNKISGWGSRCNRAACAIIASGYSNETPSELVNSIDSRYSPDIFGVIPNDSKYWSHYGLTASIHSSTKDKNYMESLKQQLLSGGYAIIWLNNGGTYIGKSGTQWTSVYHWVAVIDYKHENGTDKICIADWRGITWVDIDEFKANGITYTVYVNEK